jgi:PAS domain S-box-containing protein
MNTAVSTTLVSPLEGESPHAEHFVQFYIDDQVLIDSLAEYVRHGAGEGAAVIVIATGLHRQALASRLQSQGFDAAKAGECEQLILLDAERTLATFMVDGAPDRERFLASMGALFSRATRACGRIAVFGEMVALLWKEGRTAAAVRLEQLWNELARDHVFTLFCAYSLQDCAVAEHIRPLEDVCASHTRVIPVEGYVRLSPKEQQRAIVLLQQKAYMLEKRLEQGAVLQRTAANLAAIVESSDDAIISKSLDGRIQTWNAAAERIFGYCAEEAVGQPIALIIPPDRLEEEQYILDTLRRGERIEHFETTRVTKDGREIDLSLTISPVRDAAGVVVGASKIARDITARKRAEKRLRESEHALREADRRKSEFLALLSHELRNPLAPIGIASELLSRIVADDTRALTAVDIIKRQARQLTRLVDDLLDIGRITQGRIQLRRKNIDLASVIAQAVETVEPQLHEKQHEISISTSSPGPLYVSGDFTRLVQCVVNILSNAAKYSDPHGKIRIETRVAEQSAVIEIADTGAGITPELLPRIFDLFVQSDRTLDRAQGGLGIGLSIVKRLIEMHEGQVTARSPGLGRGSTFEIRLPRVARLEAESGDGAPLKVLPRRVLIVDDNVDAANSLALLLGLGGHETQVAYGGREALERVEAFQPEVVLLDIGLPEMDGYELAGHLRAMPQSNGFRLIALTGYGQSDDHQHALAAGFDDHLTKPVDLPTLERTLARIFGG